MTPTEAKENTAGKARVSGAWNWWCWLSAYAPALAVLGFIIPRRVPLPYQDSWAFVEQYQRWCEGLYGWREFFTPHNVHPSAPGKAVYFAVLHFARGDVALLPLLSWALSLLISLGVLVLSRSLWQGRPARGAGLMFLANLSIFTAAQGNAWIWDFVFQNFFPGTCLVLGLLALSGARIPWWRWTLAVLLALISAFAFGTGFAVGFLLWPAVALALESRTRATRVLLNAAWLIFCTLAGWVALNAFGPGERSGLSAEQVLLRPLEKLYYVLGMLGHTLGRGTAVELVPLCAAWGVLLLVVFLFCSWKVLARRDRALLRRSWPWIAFCLWAIFNAAVICVGRFRVNPETGLADHYGTFMLFLPLGALMLAATVWQSDESRSAPGWMRKMVSPAVATLLIAQALSWHSGVQRMELFHRRMASRHAALDFTNVLPAVPAVFYHLDFGDKTAALARFLMERNRLRGVVFARDALVSSFPLAANVASKRGNLKLVADDEGMDELRGVCGLPKDPEATPDLVLIAASAPNLPERIIAMVAPELPDDFFERVARRRKFLDHYFGWRWPVDRGLVPDDGEVTLRAYAYDGAKRKIRLIQGEARLVSRKP